MGIQKTPFKRCFLVYAKGMKIYLYTLLSSFRQGVKSHHLNYFTVANPAIAQGGMFDESKEAIYDIIPDRFTPNTLVVYGREDITDIVEKMNNKGLRFPIFIKPDVGLQGYLVKKIDNEKELARYLEPYTHKKFLIQEFLDHNNEYALLYYKYPETGESGIFSLSSRSYPFVVGDGKKTLKELLEGYGNDRVDRTDFMERYKDLMDDIVEKGQKFIVDYVGNYKRGSELHDEVGAVDNELVQAIDQYIGSIDGLHFIRLDLKAHSIEDIKKGDFKIIEVNGAKAESMHKYDNKYTDTDRMKILDEHWHILGDISRQNIAKGYKPGSLLSSVKSLLNLWRILYFEK